jgi:polygalacturonase
MLKDTNYIQNMINNCPSNGTVVIPEGRYVIGSIFLKSDITLEISEKCILLGSEDLGEYPLIMTRVAGIEMEWPAALINAIDCKNVVITGKGSIDGKGRIWWEKYWGKTRKEGMLKEYTDKGLRWVVDYDCQRPQSILIQNCSHVDIVDIISKDSGFWNIHLLFSHNVKVNNVKIFNGKGPSTDGIDIDSCENVLIENCYVTCNDDNVCIKAGRGNTAFMKNRICNNITVRNCTFGDGEGLTLGSEVSGGIENIIFENIVMKKTRVGFRIKSSRNRGGFVRNVTATNLRMEDVGTPIQINLDWFPLYSYGSLIDEKVDELPVHWRELLKDVKGKDGLTNVQDIHLNNISVINHHGKVQRAFYINGYNDKPIKDFKLENIEIFANTMGSFEGIESMDFSNVAIHTKQLNN